MAGTMSQTCFKCAVLILLLVNLFAYQRTASTNFSHLQRQAVGDSFLGSKAGDERTVNGVKLCGFRVVAVQL